MNGFYKDMFAILGVPSLLSMLSFFCTLNEFCDWIASYDKFLPLMFMGKHVMFAFLIECCFAIAISLFFRLCVKFTSLKVCCFPVDKEFLEKSDMTILGVNIFLMSYSFCILLVIVICYAFDVDYIFYNNYLQLAMIVLLLVAVVILGKWGLMHSFKIKLVAIMLLVIYILFLECYMSFSLPSHPICKDFYYINEQYAEILLPVGNYTIRTPLGEEFRPYLWRSDKQMAVYVMDFSRNDCVAGEYKILKGSDIEKQFWVVFVGTQNNREEYFNKYVSLLRRDSSEAYNNNQEFIEKIRVQALAGDGNKLTNSLNEIDGSQELDQNEKEALVNFVCRIRVDPTFRK